VIVAHKFSLDESVFSFLMVLNLATLQFQGESGNLSDELGQRDVLRAVS
jgi:hypothetical protein